jgi:NTE family protein
MDKKVGLALGGGGARGFAHIGVLKVLEKEEVAIDLVAGTSMGAVMGAAYASGMKPEDMQKIMGEYVKSPLFQNSSMRAIAELPTPENEKLAEKIVRFVKGRFYMARTMYRPGILPVGELQMMIDHFVPDVQIEHLKIPFAAVATDLMTGEKVTFSKGSLRKAVLASCAVPGAVEPVRDGDRLLADGGIVSVVPVNASREQGADVVIAVVVDRDIRIWTDDKTAKDIFYRAGDIAADKLARYELKDADVVVRPRVGNLHWTDFSRLDELVLEGERATREAIEKIDDTAPFFRRWGRRIKKIMLFDVKRQVSQLPSEKDRKEAH